VDFHFAISSDSNGQEVRIMGSATISLEIVADPIAVKLRNLIYTLSGFSPERAQYNSDGRSPSNRRHFEFKPCKGEIINVHNVFNINYFALTGLEFINLIKPQGFTLC